MKSFLINTATLFQFLGAVSSAALSQNVFQTNSTANEIELPAGGEAPENADRMILRSNSCSEISAEKNDFQEAAKKIACREISRSESCCSFRQNESAQSGCYKKVNFSVFRWRDFLAIEQNFKSYPYMAQPFKTDSLRRHLNVITCLVLRHAKDSSNDNIHAQNAACADVQISNDNLELLRNFAHDVPHCTWVAAESDRNKKTAAQILGISPDLITADKELNEMKFPRALVQGNTSKKRAASHAYVRQMIQDPTKAAEENSESFDDVVFRFLGALVKIGEKSSNIAVVSNTGTMNCLLRFYDPNMKQLHLLNHLSGFVIKIIPSLGITAVYSKNRQPILLTPSELKGIEKYFSRR